MKFFVSVSVLSTFQMSYFSTSFRVFVSSSSFYGLNFLQILQKPGFLDVPVACMTQTPSIVQVLQYLVPVPQTSRIITHDSNSSLVRSHFSMFLVRAYRVITTHNKTMVKGNRQRRIEQVEARKKESKQNRRKKDNRANFKAMVSNLIKLMDVHYVPNGTLHIWTEAMPVPSSSDSPTTEVDDDGSSTRQRRQSCSGSSTFAEIGEVKTKSCKPRDEGGRGKKVHPQNRGSNLAEVLDDRQSSNNSNATRCLCKMHFYKGRCDGANRTGKKSACRRLLHYSEEHKTLGQIITQDHHNMLDRAEKAMDELLHDDKEDPLGGMNMIYYFPIILSRTIGNDDDEVPSLGRVMSQALSLKKCPCASIVYVTYENEIIFDRYQNGLLIPDLGTVFTDSKPKNMKATLLPGAILEFILSFLPDEAVASMAQVCSAWHDEIGMSSSHLWQTLLDRRQWPRCDRTRSAANDNHNEAQRSFKIHYKVDRDLRALSDALVEKPPKFKTVFLSHATWDTNLTEDKVLTAMWSPTEVLTACRNDCSVRLFKAAEKGSGGGRTCHELIRVSFDPYRKTVQARRKQIHAMALGDTNIIILTGSRASTAFSLSIVSRDDYLGRWQRNVGTSMVGIEGGSAHHHRHWRYDHKCHVGNRRWVGWSTGISRNSFP